MSDPTPVVTPKPRKPQRGTRKLCFVPDCPEPGQHCHHITYDRLLPKTKRLCRGHHQDITAVNINHAYKNHRRLSDAERWELWNGWLAGTVKPIYNKNVMRWISRWRR